MWSSSTWCSGCGLALAAGLASRSGFAWLCAVSAFLAALLLRFITPLRSTEIALGAYDLTLLALLLVHRQAFSRRSRVTTTASATAILAIFLIYAVLGTLRLGNQFHPAVPDLQTAAYFVMVTFATVGYGDITPQTPEAGWFVLTMILLGILVGGTVLSAVLIPVLEGRMKGRSHGKGGERGAVGALRRGRRQSARAEHGAGAGAAQAAGDHRAGYGQPGGVLPRARRGGGRSNGSRRTAFCRRGRRQGGPCALDGRCQERLRRAGCERAGSDPSPPSWRRTIRPASRGCGARSRACCCRSRSLEASCWPWPSRGRRWTRRCSSVFSSSIRARRQRRRRAQE